MEVQEVQGIQVVAPLPLPTRRLRHAESWVHPVQDQGLGGYESDEINEGSSHRLVGEGVNEVMLQ